jgi:hypothetical protein
MRRFFQKKIKKAAKTKKPGQMMARTYALPAS